MRKVVFASAVALVGLVGSAFASPIVSYQIKDGSTVIGSGSSSNGIIVGALSSDPNFTVVFSATGAPFQPVPYLSSNDFSIATTGAAGTLTIMVTNTGLSAPRQTVENTFTTNSLDGGGFLNDTISNYYDNSNTAFGTATLLSSVSYSGLGSFSTGPVAASLVPSSLFSETSVYTLNFAAGRAASSVSSSAQIVGTTPEPNSLVLLGTGLIGAAGLAFARRRQAAEVL